MKSIRILSYLIISLFVVSCDKSETDFDDALIVGTGSYTFESYAPFSDKPIDCFYHIPENASSDWPIMIALHGAGRDAVNMRNYLVEKADQNQFIVLAPEFSEVYFPGASAFNMANIFADGDNPSKETQRPEEEWTFSVIDPLFENFKSRIGNTSSRYDIFGHSAGSQMLQRFLTFSPDAKFNRVVCAAAGWYMIPQPVENFPYGTGLTPAEPINMGPVFAVEAYIIVGENDTDPNSFNLRHTPEADEQGDNRVERAQYYYLESRDIAISDGLSFRWSYNSVPNTGHEWAKECRVCGEFTISISRIDQSELINTSMQLCPILNLY